MRNEKKNLNIVFIAILKILIFTILSKFLNVIFKKKKTCGFLSVIIIVVALRRVPVSISLHLLFEKLGETKS
jgi:hypothetical protein